MKLRLLFCDYSRDNPGSMPVTEHVSDNYTEENLRGLPTDYLDAKKRVMDSGYPWREVFLTVPDNMIRGVFKGP